MPVWILILVVGSFPPPLSFFLVMSTFLGGWSTYPALWCFTLLVSSGGFSSGSSQSTWCQSRVRMVIGEPTVIAFSSKVQLSLLGESELFVGGPAVVHDGVGVGQEPEAWILLTLHLPLCSLSRGRSPFTSEFEVLDADLHRWAFVGKGGLVGCICCTTHRQLAW